MDYMYNDYLTAMLGQLLLPLGTYNERGAGWLNKFPDDPLPGRSCRRMARALNCGGHCRLASKANL